MTFPIWQTGNEDAFWRVVELCLVKFFGFDEAGARQRVADFRVQLDHAKLDTPQSVYHAEPLNIASDMAGRSITLNSASAETYRKILQEVA